SDGSRGVSSGSNPGASAETRSGASSFACSGITSSCRSASCAMAPHAGAATVPPATSTPFPSGSSITTRIATRGASAGANPRKLESRLSPYPPRIGSTFCAVPVLPATRWPSRAARVPVPFCTTSSSISVTWRAVSSRSTRRTSSRSRESRTVPSGATTFATRYGLSSTPPFAIAAIAVTVWMPVALMPCPKAVVFTAIKGMRRGSARAPAARAGKPPAGLLADPERAQAGDQLLLAEPLADLGGADVRGLAQNGGGRRPVHRVRVVDLAPGVRPQAVLTVEQLVRPQQALLDRAGHHEALDGRAGLELILDGAIAPDHRVAPGLVPVEGWVPGQSEHRPGVHVQDHRPPPDRRCRPHRLGQLLLGGKLDGGVQRERHGGASEIGRVRRAVLEDHVAPRVARRLHLHALAAQLRIQLALQALLAAVLSHEAEHVAGQPRARKEPLGLLDRPPPAGGGPPPPPRCRLVDPALDPDEPAIGLLQLLQHLGALQPQRAGQPGPGQPARPRGLEGGGVGED